jgi:guanyl-specific ribonuclease Sa
MLLGLGLVGLLALLLVLRVLPAGGSSTGGGVALPSVPTPAATVGRSDGSPSSSSPSSSSGSTRAAVPASVLSVLTVVEATGQPPRGYVGGRHFLNDGRGGTRLLPEADAQGRPVRYTEYDVHPHRPGVNRGPQRLVIGDDGSAYYTADHYETWTRIR